MRRASISGNSELHGTREQGLRAWVNFSAAALSGLKIKTGELGFSLPDAAVSTAAPPALSLSPTSPDALFNIYIYTYILFTWPRGYTHARANERKKERARLLFALRTVPVSLSLRRSRSLINERFADPFASWLNVNSPFALQKRRSRESPAGEA